MQLRTCSSGHTWEKGQAIVEVGKKGAGNGKKKVEAGCRGWPPGAADSGTSEEKCC